MKDNKTNAMRTLERAKVKFEAHFYETDGQVDGVHVADVVGIPYSKCFKTLVTFHKDSRAGKTDYYVFCIPVDQELDLKTAAKAVNVKSVEMLAVKDLLKTTGYIRGGCSPVGMKKLFQTVIDASAQGQQTIYVSGGKIGTQIEINPEELAEVVGAKFEKITV